MRSASEDWLNDFKVAYDEGEEDFQGGMWATFSMPDPEITDANIEAASDAGTAVYVISRNSGEGSDRKNEKGDYQLTDIEYANLQKLGANFDKVVVVLNVGGIIDTKFFGEIEGLDSMLLMSQAGMEGGNAVADVISGKVTQSGKLTDTWAVNYEDYPSSADFANNDGNSQTEFYKDGIYVGYRYFDTFRIDPAYEFGYGLSYTTFDTEINYVQADAETVTVNATITNTGDTYSGEEVLQVYFSAPGGKLEKPVSGARPGLSPPCRLPSIKRTALTSTTTPTTMRRRHCRMHLRRQRKSLRTKRHRRKRWTNRPSH